MVPELTTGGLLLNSSSRRVPHGGGTSVASMTSIEDDPRIVGGKSRWQCLCENNTEYLRIHISIFWVASLVLLPPLYRPDTTFFFFFYPLFTKQILRFSFLSLSPSLSFSPFSLSLSHCPYRGAGSSHVVCRSTVVVCNAFRVSLGLFRLGQAKPKPLA